MMRKKKIVLLSGITGVLIGILGNTLVQRIIRSRDRDNDSARLDKFTNYFYVLSSWLGLLEEGKSIAKYLQENNYLEIAVYGAGVLGKHLIKELENTSVQVLYAIDRNGGLQNSGIKIYSLNEKLPEADLIIVTPTYDFEYINSDLSFTGMPVISLDKLIRDVRAYNL